MCTFLMLHLSNFGTFWYVSLSMLYQQTMQLSVYRVYLVYTYED